MTSYDEDARLFQAGKVRDFNDALRRDMPHGRVLLTRSVAQLPLQDVRQILELVRAFDTFNADNDPWNEHDFGKVNFEGQQYYWKIDALDLSMEYGSPDPTDETVTKRIITLMTEFDL